MRFRRWQLAIAALFAAALSAFTDPVEAAPRLVVRSRGRVQLEPAERVEGGVMVRGKLLDRASDEPIPNAVVELHFDEQLRAEVMTDPSGSFEHIFPAAPEGVHQLTATFAGDAQRTADTAKLDRFDVAKRSIALVVRAEEVSGAGTVIPIAVVTRAEDKPIEVEVELYATDLNASTPTSDADAGAGSSADAGTVVPAGALHHIATVTTDANGRATASVPATTFGPPGRKQVEARFPGSEVFNPAMAQTSLLVRSATRLSLALAEDSVAFEGEIEARGRLSARDDAPVPRVAVSLRAGDRKLKDGVTDERGEFAFRLQASELEVGRVVLQAVFESNQPWLENSRSPPQALAISERRPIPVGFTLAAFGATAIALLTFISLRARPWERWLPALRRRRAYPEEESVPGVGEQAHVGLQPARPSLTSSLKRASDFGFTGAVRDAITGKPIPGAAVVLAQPPAGQGGGITDARGHFAFESLPAGDWNVSVQATAYVTERFAISLPHRGTLRHSRVDLMPVRERIFEMYRAFAEPLLPRPRLWGVWTPRQLFHHVRQERLAPALAQLTDYVEEKYFSARLPEEPELQHAAALVEAARCEESGSVL